MATIETKEVEGKGRKRKPNFFVEEVAVITEQVERNMGILTSKISNVTNRKKGEVWEEIATVVNALGVASRSVQEVRDKWKNLHSTAKIEFSSFRRESSRTGGGPAPKPPSASSEKIIQVLGDTPAFSGLRGFETGEVDAQLPDECAEQDVNEGDTADLVTIDASSIEDDAPVNNAVLVQDLTVQPPVSAGRKRRITSGDVLKEQYEALLLKKDNLYLKQQKLQLEIVLLQKQLQMY